MTETLLGLFEIFLRVLEEAWGDVSGDFLSINRITSKQILSYKKVLSTSQLEFVTRKIIC